MSLPPIPDVPTGISTGLRSFALGVRKWLRVASGLGDNKADKLVQIADLVSAGLIKVNADGSLSAAAHIEIPTNGPPELHASDGVLCTDKSGQVWIRSSGSWLQVAVGSDGFMGDYATVVDLTAHTSDTNNPHGVTAAQAGADPAGSASSAVSGHEATHDHAKLHDQVTAGAGIDVVGQQVTNSDRGSIAVAGHESAYDHASMLSILGNSGVLFASVPDGTGYYAKVASWEHTGAYSHFHGRFRIISRHTISTFWVETSVTSAANVGASGVIVQNNTQSDILQNPGRVKLLFDYSGATTKVELWVWNEGWSGASYAALEVYYLHSSVGNFVWSSDDAAISYSAPTGVSGTTNNAEVFYIGTKQAWHEGNFTPSNYSLTSHNHSGVYLPVAGKAADSSLLNGAADSTAATANTIAKRDSAGDITVRLLRSTYAEQTVAPAQTADIAFRNSTSDNYIRFMSIDAMKAWLGLGSIGTGDLLDDCVTVDKIASPTGGGTYKIRTVCVPEYGNNDPSYYTANTPVPDPAHVFTMHILIPGVVRVSVEHKASTNRISYVQVQRNGVAVTTFSNGTTNYATKTVDVTVDTGDILSIHQKSDSSLGYTYWRNIFIYSANKAFSLAF